MDERDQGRAQSAQGAYRKFEVSRVDGRDGPGGDREGAEYFVLDLSFDPFAPAALAAYADACSSEYPALARDLVARAAEGFEWPADRMLSLAELRRAYATGALNRGWTLTLDNDVTHVYAPVDPADRVKSWDELGDEDPDTVCIFRMHPADLMDAVLARLEIPAEGA